MAGATPKKRTPRTVKPVENLQFLLSPTGRYKLGYSKGDIIPVKAIGKPKCDELVVAGYAKYIKL